jgi:SAM-dependent methyltransferase
MNRARTIPSRRIGEHFVADLCRREFEQQRRSRNERSIEYRFVFEQLTWTAPATVLDVGTGTTALPALMATAGHIVTAIDGVTDFWPAGMFNRHFHVIDEDITKPVLTGPFDFVTCVSVLEHIRNSDAAIDGMFALLKAGGYLALTCPYTEGRYSPNVYRQEDSDAYSLDVPYICQSYSREQLTAWVTRNKAEIVRQEFWRLYAGDFWSCGEMTWPPVQVAASERHQLTCVLIQKSC